MSLSSTDKSILRIIFLYDNIKIREKLYKIIWIQEGGYRGSSKLKVDEKLDIIGNEFQIPLESDIRKDVSEMCNLSQGIEDRAFERGTANGISIGKKEGLAEVVLKLIKKGVSIEQVSDMLDMDIKDVQDIIENK